MARSTVVVDNWTYEGADAHRTLLHLGDLWSHHVHHRPASTETQQRSAGVIAGLLAPLVGAHDDPAGEPLDRVAQLGRLAAERVDLVDPGSLALALRGIWAPLAALAEAIEPAHGVVAGLFLSDGGVPKSPVDSVEIGFRGVLGDRQASRAHHGRPWQAVCLWSDDVVAGLAAAGHPIRPGSAGENVSIRGIDWGRVRPGARVSLGSAVLTVTAFAIPCHKNARWFLDGDYERMGHQRGDHSRVYARVDQPGRVSLGDTVRCGAEAQ